jgi:hypothetical protein
MAEVVVVCLSNALPAWRKVTVKAATSSCNEQETSVTESS